MGYAPYVLDKPKGIHILLYAFINRNTCYCNNLYLYSFAGTHYWQETKIRNLIEQP